MSPLYGFSSLAAYIHQYDCDKIFTRFSCLQGSYDQELEVRSPYSLIILSSPKANLCIIKISFFYLVLTYMPYVWVFPRGRPALGSFAPQGPESPIGGERSDQSNVGWLRRTYPTKTPAHPGHEYTASFFISHGR